MAGPLDVTFSLADVEIHVVVSSGDSASTRLSIWIDGGFTLEHEIGADLTEVESIKYWATRCIVKGYLEKCSAARGGGIIRRSQD